MNMYVHMQRERQILTNLKNIRTQTVKYNEM